MGLGHVPTGSVCQDRQGDDLPRREHRGARAHFGSVAARRRALGSLGEQVAARFLVARGAKILARNERVGGGELDLIVLLGGIRVAVEVKTGTGRSDPMYHFDDDKAAQVRSLASQRGVQRVDYVGVTAYADRAVVRWLPAAG